MDFSILDSFDDITDFFEIQNFDEDDNFIISEMVFLLENDYER